MKEAEGYYSTRENSYDETQSERWLEFSDRAKSGDATAVEPLAEIFGEDIAHFEATLAQGTILHRVRLGFSENANGEREAYQGVEIGPPPAEKTTDMRASKAEEVVFYGADDETTAVAEVRPAVGYIVSVAQFEIARDVRVVDLTKQPELNPFEDESLGWFEEFYEMVETFGEQLATPLERADDKRDYIPCQRIVAAIRTTASYDGIRYPSAMRPD